MKDRNGNSKGVGFARIDDSKLCDVIIQELNGKSYPGRIYFINALKKLLYPKKIPQRVLIKR